MQIRTLIHDCRRLAAIVLLGTASSLPADEQPIVLRDYIQQSWTNELLTFPFTAKEGACRVESVTLTGPQGLLPVQLSGVECWPGTPCVKSAQLNFIADVAPLATNRYTIRYGKDPTRAPPPAPTTDLSVTPGQRQVEISTGRFGVRLLLGQETYAEPRGAEKVPGPLAAMRLADGTWFGGSRMYGPGKIASYSAKLTDAGPVFARVAIRYTYASGNTLELTVQVAAGDNTARFQTRVEKDQPGDGFALILSRGLPPLVFQVQDEGREDRPCFTKGYQTGFKSEWAEIPLRDYVAPPGHPAGLVTQLTPWEDWFGTFTQTRIRLKLENTRRELQIRSLDPGAWVEPVDIVKIFDPQFQPAPANSWPHKMMPVLRDPSGEVYLQVNAAVGVRKWTVSDCRWMHGVASLFQYNYYKPESGFPPETRPAVGYRLNAVKDYVLEWPGDAGRHPHLFVSRSQLEDFWKRHDADPATLEQLLKDGAAKSAQALPYTPNWGTLCAAGAYLLSGSQDVGAKTLLPARLRQALNYDLWSYQFGSAGDPTTFLYDALIDSPLVAEVERPVLRAQMAYFAYRLADPAVWSAERGYMSGNQNMTVVWEMSRGLAACTIPEHPMAKVWYRNAERLMEQLLSHMVGPAGEWPEAMGGHGRTSIDMVLAFAIAATNAGFHDYLADPRVKRMILYWAKMLTPRDPRPRGMHGDVANRRYFPAMGRDCIAHPGGTCGVMARATRDSDPELSAQLQWAWLEEGANCTMNHLGPFAYVYCDKRLPAKMPAWTSELLPRAGAVLRHGLGTPDEHQVIVYSGDHAAAFYPGHTGSIASIFAYGKPVAGAFAGSYEYQEGFLTCHVDLARPRGSLAERSTVGGYHGCAGNANMWSWPAGAVARFGQHGGLGNVSALATLPRQDYAAVDVALHYPRGQRLAWRTDLPQWPPMPAVGKPPVDWRRQVLFLKDDDPAAANYLLIRDSVKGGQPTMWQMWTVSEKIGTPDEVQDLTAFLADKPGHAVRPARELKGDRFTAVGQLGVDVEYYIASPSNTPRYTLRWGEELMDWINKLNEPEFQDLLHLQMPGDGAYYVAFFPRKRDMPVPVFQTLGDGLIIKTRGEFGTDYGFLSAQEAVASGEAARFRGTGASVQDRKTGRVLALAAKGEVRYETYALTADFAASLRIGEKELILELPEKVLDGENALQPMIPFPGGAVTVTAPGNWALAHPLPGVTLAKSGQTLVLQVPPGRKTVTLSKDR
jgi:hypothetical protein